VVTAGLTGGAAANMGTAQRFDFACALHNGRPHSRANMVAVRCVPVALPLELKLLEKHPHSSQTFLPMIVSRYLVCVAPTGKDGLPQLDGLKAFVCSPGQGINYRPGTWHHPLVVLDEPAQFAMLVWEDGTKDDCVEWPLPQPVIVTG
jgi:ureidoglycolate lyase